MKLQQENLPFRPITIKLEKHSEAVAFFGLIDKLESFRVNENSDIYYSSFTNNSFTKDEVDLIISLSNAHTEGKIFC